MSVSVRFAVEPQSQTYSDGLERVELYLLQRYEGLVQKPRPGQRRDVELVTKTGTFRGGLRTNPPSGLVYVCPDLYSKNGNKVSLARILKDNGVQVKQEIDVLVDGNTFTLA